MAAEALENMHQLRWERLVWKRVATGELYPYESAQRLIDRCQTGDTATIDFDSDTLELNGEVYPLKPMGDVRPVIEAGGLFNYARKTGMIAS